MCSCFREQLLFPLQLTGVLGSLDVEATVEGGGLMGQAGAIRLGISIALQSFVSADEREKMRLGKGAPQIPGHYRDHFLGMELGMVIPESLLLIWCGIRD